MLLGWRLWLPTWPCQAVLELHVQAPGHSEIVPGDRRTLAGCRGELIALQDDYRAWLDSLPESLQGSATAAALRRICELDLSEIEGVEPPRGFGRNSLVAARLQFAATKLVLETGLSGFGR